MKSRKVKNYNGLLAATAVGMMAVCSAKAATELNIAYDGAYQGKITWNGSTYENCYLTAFSASYAGGDPLPHGTSNPFITFCMDIGSILSTPGYWQSQTFAQANGSGNGNNSVAYVSGGLQKAASIYNNYVSGVDISTAQGELNGAALQVAIWSALYGNNFILTSDGVGNLSSVTSLAATMEATPVNPNLTSTFWNAVDPKTGAPIANQDLIGPQFSTGFSAPEPGTYGVLAGAGLLVVTLRGQLRRKLA